MTGPLWQASAIEVAAGIREKQFSCSEVMTSVVERIRALNPKLNAIILNLTDQALAEAAAADRALKDLAAPGPLFGVPVTIKVNIDVEGQATTNGVPAFANLIAPGDSPLVRNLRRAGAIIVGRTNTPEVSMRVTTVNPLHGRTRNPWHADASPGGSSGGAGAAAAAGFGPIHHGNDIGGSLRFPAFANGVTTLKPTPGRIPCIQSFGRRRARVSCPAHVGTRGDCPYRARCASRNARDGGRRSARSIVGTRAIRRRASGETDPCCGHTQQSRISNPPRH